MPLLVIILAQILLNFNLSTLQVSVDGIASSCSSGSRVGKVSYQGSNTRNVVPSNSIIS